MDFIAAVCPRCSGPLQLAEGQSVTRCGYCGVDVVAQFPPNQKAGGSESPQVANLLSLARKAQAARNYQEAYSYFTRVLESDAKHVEAWFNKGVCAGWMSTLRDFRLPEMLVAFETALQYTPPERASATKKQVAAEITSCTLAFYRLALESLDEYICLDDTWGEFLEECEAAIAALERANEYSPEDRKVIEGIIYLCQDNVQGRAYHDEYDRDDNGNPKPKVKRVSKSYEQELLAKRAQYVAKMQALDPSYSPAKITKAKHPMGVAAVVFLALVVLGGIWYLASKVGTCCSSTTGGPATTTTQAPEEPPSQNLREAVTFGGTCAVRLEPKQGSKKIGSVNAKGRYYLIETKGRWRKVSLDDGAVGWTACAVAKP